MRSFVLACAWMAATGLGHTAWAGEEPSTSQPVSQPTWSPILLNVECQSDGRTKACPAFLRGFIDEIPLLRWAPRAGAQVVLYVSHTARAREDLVFMRFTSSLPGAPSSFEVVQGLDIQATDDVQRELLRPAFERGVAPFVAARYPDAVRVEFKIPAQASLADGPTSPWSYGMWMGGYYDWKGDYRDGNFWGGFKVGRTTRRSSIGGSVGGSYSLSRSPPLEVDGTTVSLDTDSYSVYANADGSVNLTPDLAVGVVARGGHEDAVGLYAGTARLHGGASYDWFAADDPRGNRLALAYVVGAQLDAYRKRNVLGEDRAIFPSHGLVAEGEVRRDKVSYRLRVSALSQLQPATGAPDRYVLDVAPEIEVKVGDHVDLSVRFSLSKRAVPGPADVDATDFEEVRRRSYAEPTQATMFFNVNIHWDRTDPDRNDRFSVAGSLGNLDPL